MISKLIQNLNLDFTETIINTFYKFSNSFFENSTEFWRIYLEVFLKIFDCSKQEIITIIDSIVNQLLYTNLTNSNPNYKPYSYSDSISEFITNLEISSLNKNPKIINIFENKEGQIICPVSLKQNVFICDLPGFIMHSDEVKCENGIPLNIISIFETDVVINLDGCKNQLPSKIKRSFQPNCIAKFYKTNEGIKVGLFSYKMNINSPLSEEKSIREAIINSNTELKLPFDGKIPFKIYNSEWKFKKSKNNKIDLNNNENNINLSLLSSFISDIIPPLPFSLNNFYKNNKLSTLKTKKIKKLP